MTALPLKSKSLRLPQFVLVFLIVLCADQVSKHVMLGLLFDPPRYIEVGMNLNLVPVWNSGMSFGLLSDGGALGSYWAYLFSIFGEWLVCVGFTTA